MKKWGEKSKKSKKIGRHFYIALVFGFKVFLIFFGRKHFHHHHHDNDVNAVNHFDVVNVVDVLDQIVHVDKVDDVNDINKSRN